LVSGLGRNVLDYVTRRFNARSAGLIEFGSWIFAGKPLNAISRFNWNSESAEVSRFLEEVSQRVVPGSTRNWIAVNAVNNPPKQKNETKKTDNSAGKKFDQPAASAAPFPFHPARRAGVRVPYAFADSARR
jgi:hypothetical protein